MKAVVPFPRRGSGRHSTVGAAGILWRTSRQVSPALSAFVLVLALLLGLVSPLNFVAVGAVVQGLTADRRIIWAAVAFLVVVTASRTVLPVISEPLGKELARRVDRQLGQRVMRLVSAPEGIAHLEDPAVRDLISAADGVAGQGQRPGDGVRGYLQLITLKVGAFGSVLLLAQYRWWLGAGVAAGAMIIRRHILRLWFQNRQALHGEVAGLRRAEYLRDLALRPEAAKETRIFGLGPWLGGRHQAVWAAAMDPVWRRRRQIGRQTTVVDAAVLALAAAAGVPIAAGLISGSLSVARAVVLCGALSAVIGLGGFLPDADFPIRYACLALPPLLALEERLGTRPAGGATAGGCPVRGRLEFSAVGFTYPGSDRAVLDGLDLVIEPGSKVALVGANGAGKTTVIKLLARLYEPNSGTITVNGTSLADLDVSQWREQIGVIFQDFVRYELPARDNVGFGAVRLRDDAGALEETARKAGILPLIAELPRGWDSVLSRGYQGGADLSGGQWQRVALARALMAVRGGAHVLVLDEPTAALDVRAEAEFYQRFLELAGDTTTIIVSHRFSTVRRADRICVLGGGRIIEDGSHDQLIAAGGAYARMFRLQAGRITGE